MLICPNCEKEFQDVNSKKFCCYCGTVLKEKDNHYKNSILDVTKKMLELCKEEDLLEVTNTKDGKPCGIRVKKDFGWFTMKTEPERYKETVRRLTRVAEIIKENYSYLEKNSKGYTNNLKINVMPNPQGPLQIDFSFKVIEKKNEKNGIGNSTTILRYAMHFSDAKPLLDLISEKEKESIYEQINEVKKECENTIQRCKEKIRLIEKGLQNQSN